MNEIVTFGKGYKLSQGIITFVKSAKKASPGALLTVIDIDNDNSVVEFLKSENVNIVSGKEIAERFKVDLNLSPYTLKTIFFYLYVKHISKSDNFYMSDFTDVFFQKDIFDRYLFHAVQQKPRAMLFSEDNTIGKCSTNTTWVLKCYNPDIYNLLKDKKILNGGCMLGCKQSIVTLLNEMCLDTANVLGRVGNYPNIDQAILNKVVYFDQDNYLISESTVANMAQKKNKAYKWHNTVVGFGPGEDLPMIDIPDIIHQYDVNKKLEQEIYAR